MASIIFKSLGVVDYKTTFNDMKNRLAKENLTNEIWLLEHPKIFTLGTAAKKEHIIDPKDIPVFQSDRGGEVTYHGPGQIVTYALFDLSRMKLSVRETIRLLEKTAINLLSSLGIQAHGDAARPGVYVGQRKIASLGLKVRHGCSYHGVALNVDMDLKPFNEIETCGYPELDVTQLKDLNVNLPIKEVAQRWADQYLVSFSEPVVSG